MVDLYMCVYMYIYKYVYVYIYMYMYIYICMYIYIYVYVYIYVEREREPKGETMLTRLIRIGAVVAVLGMARPSTCMSAFLEI